METRPRSRIDTAALKARHPIAEVVATYRIALRPSGRALVGRCPFHPDRGRPNLHVYPETASYFCYRCGVGGDVIDFVERMERVGFLEAVARLGGDPSLRNRPTLPIPPHPATDPIAPPDPHQQGAIALAVVVYHERLLAEPRAVDYLQSRGVDLATANRFRLGFARGDELVDRLRAVGLPLDPARQVGLLDPEGREPLAGRIVIPELREGNPVWLTGRRLADAGYGPKYLSLPGPKPLLGHDVLGDSRIAYVVEGPFDWLTLERWGYPALALLGTHVSRGALAALAPFSRLILALDTDPAGREAETFLAARFGPRVLRLDLRPAGVKDVGELGALPDGHERFRAVLDQALSTGDRALAHAS
jgi:DNA primase catalytic core